MVQKILFPIDASENSQRAKEYVAEMAKKFDAKVLLIHVFTIVADVSGIGEMQAATYAYLHELEENLREQSNVLLDGAKKEFQQQGIEAETKLIDGKIGSTIVNTAKQENCDLIIVGSRGMGTLKSMLLGSVSNYVLHHTDVTVMVVH